MFAYEQIMFRPLEIYFSRGEPERRAVGAGRARGASIGRFGNELHQKTRSHRRINALGKGNRTRRSVLNDGIGKDDSAPKRDVLTDCLWDSCESGGHHRASAGRRCAHVLHAGVEPQVVAIGIKNQGHSVVDG